MSVSASILKSILRLTVADSLLLIIDDNDGDNFVFNVMNVVGLCKNSLCVVLVKN